MATAPLLSWATPERNSATPADSAGGGSSERRGRAMSPSTASLKSATFQGPLCTMAARVLALTGMAPWPTSWPTSRTGNTSPRWVKTPVKKGGAAGSRVRGPSRTTSLTRAASNAYRPPKSFRQKNQSSGPRSPTSIPDPKPALSPRIRLGLSGRLGRTGKSVVPCFLEKERGLKVLICSDSEILLQLAGIALESAGHQVFLERDAHALVPEAPGGSALLVDAALGRTAAALLRDRGFAGRVLLLGDAGPEDLSHMARELGLDGSVAGPFDEHFPARFAAAIESRRRVLIVDDSEIVAKLVKEELEAKGFHIQYAPDAEKATSIILKRATRPDLILLDINMPKVDGAQFCRFVKKNDMFKSIKVLFCSGEDKEKVQRLVTECGADGYISKDEFLGKWIVDNAG